MGAVVGVGATAVSAALGSVLQEARVEAATMPAVAMPEFLRNLRLSMDRLINFSKVKYNDMLLEICANSLESALNAQSAGADRIELCAELGAGGITPSAGTLKLAKQRLDIPVHVLIRPRSGHFTYSGPEFEVMQADILACRELGLQGIVSGVLREDFSLDLERTKALVELAAPMHFTFHRAFDWVRDPLRALEQLEGIGVSTVLTSGGRATALEGLENLGLWQKRTGMVLMAGGGVRKEQVGQFREIGLRAVHSSGTVFSKTLDLSGKLPMNSPAHGVEDRVGTTDPRMVRELAGAVKIS